jgi:hypothetical protein
MKASLLSFVFNNFSESGLFNALQAIQIRKISFVWLPQSACVKRMPNALHESNGTAP